MSNRASGLRSQVSGTEEQVLRRCLWVQVAIPSWEKVRSSFFRKWTALNLIRESVMRKRGMLSAVHHTQFVMIPEINRGKTRECKCLNVNLEWGFSSDVYQFLNLGDDDPGLVLDLDREPALDLFLGIEGLPDFADLVVGQPETRGNRSASRLPEADAGGLVPDNVILPQILNQHDHEERVGHRVQRPSVVGANVVSIPPTQLHLDINLFPAGTDSPHPDSRAQQWRPDIQEHSHVGLQRRFHRRVLQFMVVPCMVSL